MESIRQDDGNTKVLVEGVERARILEAHMGDHFSVTVKILQRTAEADPLLTERKSELLSLLRNNMRNVFLDFLQVRFCRIVPIIQAVWQFSNRIFESGN